MLKKDRRFVGIAMLISAVTLLFTFLALCCKKKNIGAAILALCAAEGICGLYLLDEEEVIKGKVKSKADKVVRAVRIPVGGDEDEEMFDSDSEIAQAEEEIQSALNTDEQI